MNIVLIGPPASGKGTQAKLICEKYNLFHLSTGDAIRKIISEKGDLSHGLKGFVDKGLLVPDEIIVEVFKKYLNEIDTQNGILLDGFPRTLSQAQQLKDILKIDYIFEIRASLDSIISRIEDRIICEKCGTNYSFKKKGLSICERCGGKLVKRSDDTTEIVTNRYNDYTKLTHSVIDYYKNKQEYHQIDGEKSVNEVFDQICSIIESDKESE